MPPVNDKHPHYTCTYHASVLMSNDYLGGGPEVGGHLRDDQHQLVQDGGSCRITSGGNNIKLGQKLTPTEYLEMLVLY